MATPKNMSTWGLERQPCAVCGVSMSLRNHPRHYEKKHPGTELPRRRSSSSTSSTLCRATSFDDSDSRPDENEDVLIIGAVGSSSIIMQGDVGCMQSIGLPSPMSANAMHLRAGSPLTPPSRRRGRSPGPTMMTPEEKQAQRTAANVTCDLSQATLPSENKKYAGLTFMEHSVMYAAALE